MIKIEVTDDGMYVGRYCIEVDPDTGRVTYSVGSGGVIDFVDDRNAAKHWVLNQVQSDLNRTVGFTVPKRDHHTSVATGQEPGEAVRYWGTCSCGWLGTAWESRELAQASTTGHYVFPEMVVQS